MKSQTRDKCKTEKCSKYAIALGYCATHYRRYKRNGDPHQKFGKNSQTVSYKKCTVSECNKPWIAREMCGLHYKRWQAHGDPLKTSTRVGCSVSNCGNPHEAKGLCAQHYTKLKRKTDPIYAEKCRARYKRWYLKQTRTERRTRRKAAWNANKEKFRASCREYYRHNKAKIAEKARARRELPYYRFMYGVNEAIRRGLSWDITPEQFDFIIKKDCTYCGKIPKNQTGIWMDRKNSANGYTIENVTPCCDRCNILKNDLIAYKEMMTIAQVLRASRCPLNMCNIWDNCAHMEGATNE